MSDIFLSYASKDVARAKQLAEALAKQGWTVWWDRTILPGKIFDQVIEAELAATKCVIVLWSSQSVESPWVRAEAEDAMKKGRLIPALLGEVKIPLVFRQYQAASLADWVGDVEHPGFQQLIQAVTALLAEYGTTATAVPATPQPAGVDAERILETQDTKDAAIASAPPHARSTRQSYRYLNIGSWVLLFLVAGTMVYINYFPRNHDQPAPVESQAQPQSPDNVAGTPERMNGAHRDKSPLEPAQEIAQNTLQNAGRSEQDAAPVHPRAATPTNTSKTGSVPKPVEQTQKSSLPKPPPPKLDTSREGVTEARQAAPATTVATSTSLPDSAKPHAPLIVLTVTWAMPSDKGVASAARVQEFSTRVSKVMTDVLRDVLNRPVDFESFYPSQKEYYRLLEDEDSHAESLALCRSKKVDLVVSGFMPGAKFVSASYGYELTRDPVFSVFDCRTGTKISDSYRVAESNQDNFPYESALSSVFREFVERKAALNKE